MANLAVPRVLPELGKAGWTTPQLLAYEIALEGIRQAVGYYAQQIAEAEAAEEPDSAAIAALREAQASWAAHGQDLALLDARAVKRVRKDIEVLLSIEVDDDDDDDGDEDDEEEDEDDEDDG